VGAVSGSAELDRSSRRGERTAARLTGKRWESDGAYSCRADWAIRYREPTAMRDIKTNDDEEFGRLVTAIADDMVTATIHWRLYQRLLEAVREFEREINEARSFWSLTFRAHLDVTLWRLGRLYDPTAGALSLPNFLATVRKNLPTFDEGPFRKRLADNAHVDSLASHVRRPATAQIQDDLLQVTGEKDPLVRALVDLRNGHLGHRDANAVLGRLDLPGLDASQVTELLERARDIVNRYKQLYAAATNSVQMVGEDDYRSVLNSIRSAFDVHESAIEKEIEETGSLPGDS
jgi:AbiU2